MYENGTQTKPHFELSYSTKDEYGLQDLTPQSWADLVERYGLQMVERQDPYTTKSGYGHIQICAHNITKNNKSVTPTVSNYF